MPKQYSYRKLRGRIVEKYGNISQFTKKLNISRISVANKLACRSGFSQEDIEEWAELLDIPVEEYGLYFFA